MAHKCGKANWDSWVSPGTTHPAQPPNDGVISIGTVDGSGKFKGWHLKSQEPLSDGECKDNPTHRIKFKRVEGNVKYTYEGEITTEVIGGEDRDVVRHGTRTSEPRGRSRKNVVTSEDWVAEKQGT